jgi:hypothetical protein
MAKYLGFRNNSGNCDQHCASDAEKAACEAVDAALGRQVTYVEVSDADFSKEHDVTQACELIDGSLVWDVENDGSFDWSQEVVQEALDFQVNAINEWLSSRHSSIVDASVVSSWESYRDELSAIDLSTKSFPMTGVHPLVDLIGNGISTWQNLKRLP